MHHETLKALLKKDGASLTSPRRIIFDLLLEQGPQDIKTLIDRSKGKPDRATVYRTLELFEKLGIIHRVSTGWKYKLELSDVFSGHHHHFYCTGCGRTYSLPSSAMLETMINSTVSKEDFAPRGHQLEVYGLCAACQS